MAVRSGFFNSIGGDRIYDARFFAEYFATFIGNGVFPNPSTGLQVTAGQNLTTVVKPGKGWINGYYLVNDSDFILQHDIADGVLKRVDRVVMKLDYLTREINIYVKKGTFASNPVGPALQRDLDAYELSLADVLINNGEIQISQARITDTRMNGNLCGIVSGLVNQVDTTTLYQQYETFWNSYRTQRSQDFEDLINNSQATVDNQIANNQTALDNQINNNQTTFNNQTMMNQEQFDMWFATVQDTLSGDVAGNLLMLINENAQNIVLANERTQSVEDKIGAVNGIATTDENGNVPLEQLDNVLPLISQNAKSSTNDFKKPVLENFLLNNISFDFLRDFDSPLEYIAKQSNSNTNPALATFDGINKRITFFPNTTSGNNILIYSIPIFADNIDSIDFAFYGIGNSSTSVVIGTQKVLDFSSNFDSDNIVFSGSNLVEKTLDLSSINGYTFIKIRISNSNVATTNAILSKIKFNAKTEDFVFDNLNGNFSLSSSTNNKVFTTKYDVNSNDFVSWLNFLSQVNLKGGNVTNDLYDNNGNLLKSGIVNGENLSRFSNNPLVIKSTFTRSPSGESPTISSSSIKYNATAKETGEVKIAEITLSDNATEVSFENLDLESYRYFKISVGGSNYQATQFFDVIYNEKGTGNLYNFISNSGSAVSSTFNANYIRITGRNLNLSANNNFKCLISINNDNANSGTLSSNFFSKFSTTINYADVNGSWSENELINSVKITSPFSIGTKIILYGVKRDV